MRDRNVKALLFLTILVMTVLPMVAALYLLDSSLQTSLNLGFNRQIVQTLEQQSQNLRTLRTVDPENRDRYREQFVAVEELRQVYANPEMIKDGIRGSLIVYFGLGLVAAVLVAVVLAALLSRSIARAHAKTFAELASQKEKVRYLEELSSWQELAKMLAHEIKNPLTPIEVLVTSLSKAYLAKPQVEFQAQLKQTETMINEELAHLKNTVNKFSEFAKLPSVRLTEENLPEILTQHLKSIGPLFEAATIRIDAKTLEPLRAKIDATLFRQVLTNIVRNGVEANPGRGVEFTIQLSSDNAWLRLAIANDGEPVPAGIAGRIFDPYVSTKSGKDNMGLGLAIVRKIVIEHGGDIGYADVGGHPVFTISLPKAA